MYDVIIKNGTLLDGTGTKAIQTNIAISKEKIAKVGPLTNEEAEMTLDAKDLYVAPGFIDLTTHSDNHWTLFSHPHQESFLRQGVTTILGGHGGSSLAPIINKESIGSIERWVEPSQININWQSLEEYFKELEKHKLAINFATLIGHETLRRNILGDEAREADEKEISGMKELLNQALKEGAFGLSTNLGTFHSRTASEKELKELLGVIKEYKSISIHHLENEGKDLLPALSRLIKLFRSTATKGHLAHFKALGKTSWGYFKNALTMIENAQQEGILITCDFFPYTKTGSSLTSLLPNWFLAKDADEAIPLLKEKTTRQDLIEHLKELTLHYERIIVASAKHSINSVGKSIKQISATSGFSEEEIILNLLEVNDLRVSIFNEVILEENIELLSTKQYSAIASDGVGHDLENTKFDLTHPRSFGTFPRVFDWLVKTRQLLSWEEAVYKMSGLPAAILGLKNRGIVKQDNYADIVIFDPKKITDKATYQKPFQFSEGINYVFVNGALILSENELKTENISGKIIKKE